MTAAPASLAHEAVKRALGLTLHLGDADAFTGLAKVLRAKLAPPERQGLAWAALLACDEAEAEAVAAAALPSLEGAGPPLPPFLDVAEDAAWWGDLASPAERRAYLVAAFEALPAAERREFLAFAQRRTAA